MMRAESTFGLFATFFLALAANVAAHPLGNFSISQYSALQIGVQDIEVRYIVDMAEIPTFQEIQEIDFVPGADDVSAKAYTARKAESLRGGLMLEINGRLVPLRPESHEIIFPEGAGGLPTLKIGVVYKGIWRPPAVVVIRSVIATTISPGAPAGKKSVQSPAMA